MNIVHPIINLLHGRRLYYLFADTIGSIKTAKSEIETILVEHNCRDRSCFYVVFGEADFVIRLWAEESEMWRVYDAIFKSRFLDVHGCFLCSRLSTWYQRDIESSVEWHRDLSAQSLSKVQSSVTKMLKGNIPGALSRYYDESKYDHDDNNSLKFLILIREHSLSETRAYNQIEREVRHNGDRLSGLKYISLYSAYSAGDDLRATVFKAEADSFGSATRALQELTDWLSLSGHTNTTTYIVAEPIWETDMDVKGIAGTAPEDHRNDTIQNLALTAEVSLVREERHLPKRVYEGRRAQMGYLLSSPEAFASLFWYDDTQWYRTITRLRLLNQIVLRKKNDELKAHIISDYIFYERELYCLFKKLSQSQIVNNHFKGVEGLDMSNIALGEMIIWVNKIGTSAKCKAVISSDEQKTLRDFKECSVKWLADRNMLAHGIVLNLFKDRAEFMEESVHLSDEARKRLENDNHECLWQTFLFQYFNLRALFPRVAGSIARISEYVSDSS